MKRLLLILSLLILPAVVSARASLSVPVDERVYRAIDRLVAAGVVDNIIMGQRPFTRDNVAGILLEAERNFDRLTEPSDKMMVFRILKYWKGYFSIDEKIPSRWRVKFLERLDIDYLYLHGPDRTVPDDNFGAVDAHVRPLTEYEDGRHFFEGYNYAFESYHSLVGPYLAVFAHPRFQLQIRANDDDGEDKIFVQELYAKAGWRNLEFEIGRDEIAWGQGEFGGLMFSSNARALDFIKLSNPYPARLPWVFRHIGNVKGTIFLANMGPKYNYRYSYLAAMKLSIQPCRYVEFGPYYGFITGGKGAPSASYRMGGVDIRFRIPPLSDLEIYSELYLESLDLNRPGTVFRDNTGYVGGLYLPRLVDSHNMALRFEYKHLGPAVYRSWIWRDGFALSGEFLGDPLGPGGDGIYADYYYDLGVMSRLIARFAYERRSAVRPMEKRYRGILSLEHPVKKIARLAWHLGLEAIDDFNCVSGDDRRSVIGGVNLSLNLGL